MTRDKVVLLAEDCVEVNNVLYFVSKDINVVFGLDITNGNVFAINCLPEHGVLDKRLGAKILSWNDELIFAPMKAKKVWRYNLQTKNWMGYERKLLEAGKTGTEMFDAVLYNDTAFIIGCNYPAIMKIELLNNEITYIEEPYQLLKEKKHAMGDSYFRTSYARIENRIFLASCLDNLVLEFDLESLEFKWHEVGRKGNCYSGISWDGKYFWIAPRNNTPLVRWNGKDDVIEYSLPEEFRDCKNYFLGVVSWNDEIILPGFESEYSLIMEKGKMGAFKKVSGQFLFFKEMCNGKVISCTADGELVIRQRDEEKRYALVCEKEMLLDVMKTNFIESECKRNKEIRLIENDLFSIETFIEWITVK